AAVHVTADAHVVVAAGREHAVTVEGGPVVHARLRDGATDGGRQVQALEDIPPSAHAHEVGAAVHGAPLVVARDALRAVVAHDAIAHGDVAHAQRLHRLQIDLQHESVAGEV